MTLPLAGIQVLETGTSLGGAYAGKLLAELGARVLLLEPPAGSLARHTAPAGPAPAIETAAPHLYANAGKESAVLDLGGPSAAGLLRTLIPHVDVVLHSYTPAEAERLGLLPDQAHAAWPSTIFASVTPFGLTGPWAHFPATELTVAAIDGYMHTTGDPGLEPLANFAHEVEYAAGQVAVVGILAALRAREIDGAGDYADISLIEVNNAALDAPLIGGYEYLGRDLDRKGNLTGAFGPLKTKDGFVYVAPIQENGYVGLLLAAGRADLLDDPRLADFVGRLQHREMLDGAVQEWSANLTTLETLEAVQETRVPSAPALSMQQILDDPQIEARGLLQDIDQPIAGTLRYPGAPFLSDHLTLSAGRAPLLGEHQAALEVLRNAAPPARQSPVPAGGPRRLPLEGLRIVDLTQVWAGPFTTVMLAELGADAIHIESPTRPDMTRFWTVRLELEGDLWEKSSYFSQHNRGKRSLILDLAHEEARQVLRELVAECDLVINNYSRRVMDNWGFTYESLLAHNPRLIYVTMPSYGATGPHRDYVSFGDSLQAAAGLVRWRGYGPDEPRRAGSPMPDPYSAYAVAALILAALRHRDATGEPVYLDVSQRDAALRLVGDELLAYQLTGEEPHQFENEHREWAPHRAYRCAGEDHWVTIACRNDAEFAALCGVMLRPGLASDPRFAHQTDRHANRAALDEIIAEWTARLEAKWVETYLLRAGVPAGVVQRASDILVHPQYLHRDFFPWTHHPTGGDARLHSTPVFLHNLPHARTNRAGPVFGEHTHEVLRDLLGKSDAEIAALEASGAVGGLPDVSGVVIWTE